jgi:hypothetical protein
MMTKRSFGKTLLVAGGVAALIAVGMTAVNADDGRHHDRGIRLSDRPKTIVIDNLDTAMFTKGDPAAAAYAQEICGDCHSTDYPMTQPKLNCAGWAKEIVKMGNTFRANIPWTEDGVTKAELYEILAYLNTNYGAGDACAANALDTLNLPVPLP